MHKSHIHHKVNTKKERLDSAVAGILAIESYKEAEAYIRAGQVQVDDIIVDKPGFVVPTGATIKVKVKPFVSRAGEKLSGLIADLSLADFFYGACVLDIGASTGGFTDCSLQLGASKIYAVDVGTAQLHWRLKTDKRVLSFEQTDIRKFVDLEHPPFDLILADISFTSVACLLPTIKRLMSDKTLAIILIKPQFELAKEKVPKGGVISDAGLRQEAVHQVISACAPLKLKLRHAAVPAKIKGRDGNQEFFIVIENLL